MAGFIKLKVEKLPVQPINTKVNSEIFEEFQRKLKQQNIPMNVIFTVFAQQYANGRYHLDTENILKWKDDVGETSTLNTPINKTIYYQFKNKVKANGFFIKNVVSAFIEDYAKNDLIMEFAGKNISEIEEK